MAGDISTNDSMFLRSLLMWPAREAVRVSTSQYGRVEGHYTHLKDY